MEKLSRVKKYEDLRKQIEANVETSMDLEKQTSIETLHTIDPSHYKKMKIEDTSPKREQNEVFEEDAETFQFKNEFLDEFINEVREYNLKKGNRVEDDTQMDILSQLKGTAPKRNQYISPLETEELTFGLKDTTSSFSKEEIAKQVQELLQDDDVLETSNNHDSSYIVRPFQIEKEDMVEQQNNVENDTNNIELHVEEAEPVVDETMEISLVNEMDEVSRKLVEETQKMKVQLDNYEEELTGLNNGLDRTHRMLNIILCLLIICLIGAIGFVVYYVVQSGGIL